MTYRITFVGNSHVAALRNGWKRIQASYDLDARFFAANSTLYGMLEMSEDKVFGALEPSRYSEKHLAFLEKAIGGLSIDLKQTDAVVVVGHSIREKDFLRNLGRFSVDSIRPVPGAPHLSEDAFHAFCRGTIEKGLPKEHWRNWESPKVFLTSPPVPCENCPADDERYALWAKFGAVKVNNVSFLRAYHQAVADVLAEHGITLVRAPEEVLTDRGLTMAKYGEGAGRLDSGLTSYRNDFHHMNASYGEIAIRKVIDDVTAALDAGKAQSARKIA